jgi:hypothetical protein
VRLRVGEQQGDDLRATVCRGVEEHRRLRHVVDRVVADVVVREQDAQYNTTRPLEPPYSLHTVLLKVEAYNDTPDVVAPADSVRLDAARVAAVAHDVAHLVVRCRAKDPLVTAGPSERAAAGR